MVETLLGPRLDDDLDLLCEKVESLSGLEEREAVREVLALVPTRAQADLDPPAGDVVDRHGHPRDDARMSERGRGDERPEPDALG